MNVKKIHVKCEKIQKRTCTKILFYSRYRSFREYRKKEISSFSFFFQTAKQNGEEKKYLRIAR